MTSYGNQYFFIFIDFWGLFKLLNFALFILKTESVRVVLNEFNVSIHSLNYSNP
jgi:hypothetical protein